MNIADTISMQLNKTINQFAINMIMDTAKIIVKFSNGLLYQEDNKCNNYKIN